MSPDFVEILAAMGSSLLAGSLIGLERTYHGRPAGFRTHAIVCLASTLLMLVTTHQAEWVGSEVVLSTIRTDPTRMAQGIMTGIGFLGAGVIFKEGLTVRGLTTAASIWMTAALGILYGVGFQIMALIATLVTLAVLGIFRLIENSIPVQSHLAHVLRLPRDSVMDEVKVREFLDDHGFHVASMSYELLEQGRVFEYQMVIRTYSEQNVRELAEALRERADVLAYSLSPLG